MPQEATKQRGPRADREGPRARPTMNQPARNETGATPRRKFDETYKRHAVESTLHGDQHGESRREGVGAAAMAAV